MIALANCPFCSSQDLILKDGPDGPIMLNWVLCTACNSTGPAEISKTGAIEAWNDRPGPEPVGPAKLLVLLEEALEHVERWKELHPRIRKVLLEENQKEKENQCQPSPGHRGP
jgi:Lar family restriction alleviation protein